MVKDLEMGRLFVLPVWAQRNHEGPQKRETEGSKIEKDVMREAGVGVTQFEDGGEAVSQGLRAAPGNTKAARCTLLQSLQEGCSPVHASASGW